MRSVLYLGVTLASLAGGPLAAQPGAASSQPAAEASAELPAAAALAAATAIATVEAIDMTTREVTLRKEDGEVVSLVVSEEARNLGQVRVGDRVIAQYQVGLVVALRPPGIDPARIEDTEVVRSAPGERPAGAIRRTVAVTATIVEIDTQRRIVTLRGPERVVALPVADDIDLSKASVGDRVGAIYEESFAVLVEPIED